MKTWVSPAEKAKEHLLMCENPDIKELSINTIKHTKMYKENYTFSNIQKATTNVVLKDSKTENEIFLQTSAHTLNETGMKVAALNFASYKYAGGMYLQGSTAQEESLCAVSNLFPILEAFEKVYYEPNRKEINKALYKNRALYTPDVHFSSKDMWTRCDILTCAAPNWATISRFGTATKKENNAALKDRINFVLDILVEQGVNIAILGAYGCGVFRQNPTTVAQYFLEGLKTHYFDKVIFAIPDIMSYNYQAFYEEIHKWSLQQNNQQD